jgi:hypothetical protein
VCNKLEQKQCIFTTSSNIICWEEANILFKERPSVKFQVDTSTAAAAALEQSLMM